MGKGLRSTSKSHFRSVKRTKIAKWQTERINNIAEKSIRRAGNFHNPEVDKIFKNAIENCEKESIKNRNINIEPAQLKGLTKKQMAKVFKPAADKLALSILSKPIRKSKMSLKRVKRRTRQKEEKILKERIAFVKSYNKKIDKVNKKSKKLRDKKKNQIINSKKLKNEKNNSNNETKQQLETNNQAIVTIIDESIPKN
eukprot:TRINITY_DN562_c0_g1_i1.p1 TRINITY_DN562_c0_g1~~TRINITY_DN562_c0_g1_i1.p1  ORF type:complete len:198 (+),score=80.65 TRINITY_DN562_c0_g1_i1:104-697(+)